MQTNALQAVPSRGSDSVANDADAASDGRAAGDRARGRVGDLIGSFALSYLAGGGLLLALFLAANPWRFLANSRLLDVLISGGVIRYHDRHMGYIDKVPHPKYYLMSQDPVDFRYVYAAGAACLLFWVVMAFKFHGIARFCGLKGSLGQHARAYIYGDCLNRYFPFWMGNVATAAALEGQGEPRRGASVSLYIQDLFVMGATIAFGLVGVLVFGWKTMFLQLMWAFVILAVTWYLARSVQRAQLAVGRNPWVAAWGAVKSMVQEPLLLCRLGALALLGVLCDHLCPYFISRAFSSEHVLLNIDFLTIQKAVIAGYVCRMILYTPGGIGAYEWGLAAALYMCGVGFPEAATVALLDCLIRNVTTTIGFVVLKLFYTVETDIGSVLRIFTRAGGPGPAGTA
ncbi:lysylphosphatidylglycerol synthase domain-containing protein [Sorangium sp. So ce315]|uniref:lysylphosphatidylglycerol synthase domain-containing protein n=1 Tax=Sorangium sp. So ce315 TaxID=3133299 RepID=UPI003F63FDA9